MVSEDLKSNTAVMDVKGRQGWQINQEISYGGYFTSKVKRGWTTGYNMDFVVRFQKATEKLSYIQNTCDHKQAEVLAVSEFKNTEVELLNGFLAIPIKYKNVFAGTIIPADTSGFAWDFIVYNPDGSLNGDLDCGLAKSKFGDEIIIRAINKLDNNTNRLPYNVYGYEFVHNGKPIGAVSTINKGKVMIKNDLCPDYKLILSSLSTAILLRHNMEEAAEN